MSKQHKYFLAGVMGYPVMHSRSPRLHNYWLELHGIEGHYAPIAVRREGLEKALRALHPLGYSGVNLTIPLKEAALNVVDHVHPVARQIGAINCVVVNEDGTLEGYNYDAYGFIASLREAEPHWKASAGPVVVLGAGGAARAVLAGLIEDGAQEIRLANRTKDRASALAMEFGEAIQVHDWKDRADLLAGASMLVNTTSMGMTGQPPLEIALDRLARETLVADIVYVPLETDLLARARRMGNRTVDGLGMLLHQARPAFKYFFGVTPQVTPAVRGLIESTLGTV
jgi:shikimate dehydrogenase